MNQRERESQSQRESRANKEEGVIAPLVGAHCFPADAVMSFPTDILTSPLATPFVYPPSSLLLPSSLRRLAIDIDLGRSSSWDSAGYFIAFPSEEM